MVDYQSDAQKAEKERKARHERAVRVYNTSKLAGIGLPGLASRARKDSGVDLVEKFFTSHPKSASFLIQGSKSATWSELNLVPGGCIFGMPVFLVNHDKARDYYKYKPNLRLVVVKAKDAESRFGVPMRDRRGRLCNGVTGGDYESEPNWKSTLGECGSKMALYKLEHDALAAVKLAASLSCGDPVSAATAA